MNNNEKRALEIRFFLICFDIARLTIPNNSGNIINFFEFMEQMDFTREIDYVTLKELAQTLLTEKNNIIPNKDELCNFCLTNKIPPSKIKKYLKITPEYYRIFQSRIAHEPFFQPTHLQPHVYDEISKFLTHYEKIRNLGVT